jgi:hypothetical protein
MKDYPDHVRILAAEHPALAAEVGGFRGVADVLRWMQAHDLGRVSVDMVGQDEFEYDFLVQTEPGGPWLAFGIT